MSDEFERKLAAIFSADAVGYSRLMGDDDVATVRTVTAYLEVMTTLVQHHRGRVIDTPGDNILAEFASVVDAVECALEVQAVLKSRNAELPDHRRMEFRIGINLGDVIVEGDRLYGDGVNIAARLEAMADPGGICISGTVHEHIRNKLTLWNEYLGKHSVKNIAGSVEVYRLLLEPKAGKGTYRRTRMFGKYWRWVIIGVPVALIAVLIGYALMQSIGGLNAGSPEAVVEATVDRQTVAVLAFDNMSDDPAQEYFSDGITEDLITDLAKVTGLLVTARNTTFAYKGQAVNITDVGRELGVTYVVAGSVRQADGQVRISAQLIETATGGEVWANRYDRSLENIFSVQDDVVAQIVEALQVTLTAEDVASLVAKPTGDRGAHDQAKRAWWYYRQRTLESNEQARALFTRALETDSEYANAMTGLGFTYYEEWAQFWTQDPEALDRARELAIGSIALDETLKGAHTLLAHVYLWTGKHDLAINEQERALELAPNDAYTLRDLGEALIFAGRSEEAIRFVKRGMDLDPRYDDSFPLTLGMGYTVLERYDEAVTAFDEALVLNPNSVYTLLSLAGSKSALGQTNEARRYVTQALAINPQINVDLLSTRTPFKDPSTRERLINGLRQAGLK